MATDLSTLLTTVQNISGGKLHSVPLPPHNVDLDVDEEVTIWGQLTEAIYRGDRFGNRHQVALSNALMNGLITIKSTPTPVLYDEVLAASKILVLHDGALYLLDPSWEMSVTL